MAKQFDAIGDEHRAFILRQKMFFTASADREGRVNLSPKGMDTLRVLSATQVAWLDLTGSGNETAAHLKATGRLTVMFCAFSGPPMILRLYGTGKVLRRGSVRYRERIGAFEELPGARQIILLDVEMVQTSCGYAVPNFTYKGDRPGLVRWAEAQGENGLTQYRRQKNVTSLDGKPTGWPRR